MNNKNKTNKKNVINTQQNYYPKIYSHNHSTIQVNNNTIKEKEKEKEKHIKRSYSYLNDNNRCYPLKLCLK